MVFKKSVTNKHEVPLNIFFSYIYIENSNDYTCSQCIEIIGTIWNV